MMVVNGKVKRTRPVMVEHFRFLKSATRKTAKLCIPAPTYLHMRGGRRVVNQEAYPDVEEFWSDITRAYREEIADLAAAGCTYLQIDDVSFACLCDEGIRAQVKRDGEDPAKLPAKYVEVINQLLTGRSPSLGVTITPAAATTPARGWPRAATTRLPKRCSRPSVDGFFLEYDDARAGGFEPLRLVAKGKSVVFGLGLRQDPGAGVQRRPERADRSGVPGRPPREPVSLAAVRLRIKRGVGNKLTEDDQKRKLEPVAEPQAKSGVRIRTL